MGLAAHWSDRIARDNKPAAASKAAAVAPAGAAPAGPPRAKRLSMAESASVRAGWGP